MGRPGRDAPRHPGAVWFGGLLLVAVVTLARTGWRRWSAPRVGRLLSLLPDGAGPVAPGEPAIPAGNGRGEAVARAVLVALGLAALAFGAVLAREDLAARWWPVLRWAVGGIVVHDAVLAPSAFVLGLLVLPRVPRHRRAALGAGLLTATALAVLAIPPLLSPASAANPTVNSTPGWVVVSVVVLVPAVGVLLAGVIAGRRARRGGPGGAGDGAP